ncbi:MAG: hypothetical protein AAF624_16245 [Bacteroidota bacterium]
MRALRTAFVLTIALGLSGCFQLHTVLRVFPDGSGRLITSIEISEAAFAQVQRLATLDPDQKGGSSLIDEEALRTAAKGYGPGVTFEGVKPMDGERGYTATYRVEDVTTLALPLTPEPASSFGTPSPDSTPSDLVTFGFTPTDGGTPAELTIQMPDFLSEDSPMTMDVGSLGGASADTKGDPEFEMLRGVMQGMQATFRVEPQGTVTATTATFEADGTITLMRFDFDEMLADPDALNRLDAQEPPATTEDLAERIAEVPGVDVEVQPTVTVTFE